MATYGTFQEEPEQHPVPRAPAPWSLNAETYVLFMKLKELLKGVYDPLEEAWADERLGVFKGVIGCVMIVRYSSTPVGKTVDFLISALIML
jgi:hypothetical protein